ncbi:MAG: polyhydroxybutyrate depolymerase [Halioglobus sp.]|jgi:polyhydroxybutyrate depolymerase
MKFHRSPSSPSKSPLSLLSLIVVLFAAGCSDGTDGIDSIVFAPYLSGCADTETCESNPILSIDDARPAQVIIPADYNTETRYPLVILLHGFGANGPVQSLYLGLNSRVDTQQFVLVTPNGTINEFGSRYWNATPACCAGPNEEDQIDDVGYVRGLIEQAAATYSIDTTRVGLIGHSNGGFMSLRMACEASDLVTSVVSLAGSTWEDAGSCIPAEYPVSVLAMHGDADETIPYDGNASAGFVFPGALETIARFAGLAGCDTDNPSMPENIDVDASIDGAETEILRYSGCTPGVDAQLWTMVGSPHIPFPWVAQGIDTVVDWMTGHSRVN